MSTDDPETIIARKSKGLSEECIKPIIDQVIVSLQN